MGLPDAAIAGRAAFRRAAAIITPSREARQRRPYPPPPHAAFHPHPQRARRGRRHVELAIPRGRGTGMAGEGLPGRASVGRIFEAECLACGHRIQVHRVIAGREVLHLPAPFQPCRRSDRTLTDCHGIAVVGRERRERPVREGRRLLVGAAGLRTRIERRVVVVEIGHGDARARGAYRVQRERGGDIPVQQQVVQPSDCYLCGPVVRLVQVDRGLAEAALGPVQPGDLHRKAARRVDRMNGEGGGLAHLARHHAAPVEREIGGRRWRGHARTIGARDRVLAERTVLRPSRGRRRVQRVTPSGAVDREVVGPALQVVDVDGGA